MAGAVQVEENLQEQLNDIPTLYKTRMLLKSQVFKACSHVLGSSHCFRDIKI